MIATALLEAALRSLVMGAAVLLGLRMLRVRHVMARKIAWILVLLASLAMPLLMRWQPLPDMSALVVPEHLLSAPVEKAAPAAVAIPEADHDAAPMAAPAVSLDMPVAEQSVAASWPGDWSLAGITRWIVPVYLAGAAVLLLRLLTGLGLALRIWYRAERASPILEPRAWVRISRAVNAPVTIGSGIVLPESYAEWDRAKMRVVLAHERSHVRQGDFYLQLLAGIYTAIFWFSPLGWWMQRELSEAAEAISDRAALDEAANRSSYAEVLLEFAALPRRPVAGVAMARSSNIQKRIDLLLTDRLFGLAFLRFRRHALLAALLVPVALVASASLVRVEAAAKVILPDDISGQAAAPASQTVQANQEVQPSQEAQTSQEAQPSQAVQPSQDEAAPRAAQSASSAAPAPAPQATPAPVPAPAAAKAPAAKPAVPATPAVKVETVTPMMIMPKVKVMTLSPVTIKEEVRMMMPALPAVKVVVPSGMQAIDHNGTFVDAPMVVSDEDTVIFTKPMIMFQDNRIRFEHDGRQYVIDDAALVAEVKSLFKPMEELGRQQAELGKQQAALGREEARLGALQAQASVPLPDMSAQMKALEEELKQVESQNGQNLNQEAISRAQARLQARIGELQGKLAEMQAKTAVQHSAEYAAEQSKLAEQQSKLGAQQGELGKQQGKLAKDAQSKMKTMLDNAVKSGKAKPVD